MLKYIIFLHRNDLLRSPSYILAQIHGSQPLWSQPSSNKPSVATKFDKMYPTKCCHHLRYHWIKILPPLFGEIIEQPWWVTATCSRYCTTGWTDERSTMAKVRGLVKKTSLLNPLRPGCKVLTGWQLVNRGTDNAFIPSIFLLIKFTGIFLVKNFNHTFFVADFFPSCKIPVNLIGYNV